MLEEMSVPRGELRNDDSLGDVTAGLSRLVPAVGFGLRTAVLSGAVGTVAFGVATVVSLLAGGEITDTTCCPPDAI